MSGKEPDNLSNESLQDQWKPGQLLLGEFEVQRLLGWGGMGAVYQVHSRKTGMQFAVKRALIKDAGSRKNFLGELQTWIDLPEHPNIVACRFFRTIDDEIVIFSEYVGGGTLAEWIQSRRLTKLESILDVAIQFAQGLFAIHEHGLIHQDVKPGNVLMTPEAVAKVTDFGLARARYREGNSPLALPSFEATKDSILISSAGMTPAYRSPEQAGKIPLSHKTDIWSWGVSVLDIFIGGISCRYGGQIAGDILKAYLEASFNDGELPRMPGMIVRILSECFQLNPEQRWGSMSEIVEALMTLYLKSTGRTYQERIPEIVSKAKGTLLKHDRRIHQGAQWSDPLEWLAKVYQALGREPSQGNALISMRKGSRKAQAIADLAIYEEACRLFEELAFDGKKDFRHQLVIPVF